MFISTSFFSLALFTIEWFKGLSISSGRTVKISILIDGVFVKIVRISKRCKMQGEGRRAQGSALMYFRVPLPGGVRGG
jgi:hypothetical protein